MYKMYENVEFRVLKSQRMTCKFQKEKLVGLPISKGKIGGTILLKLHAEKNVMVF